MESPDGSASNSEFEDEYCMPGIYSSQESLAQLSSSTSHSQNLSGDGSIPSFKRIPSLSLAFCKIGYDKNRQAMVSCSGCHENITTNREHRLATHARKCKSLSAELKRAIADECSLNCRANLEQNGFDLNMELARMIVRNCLPMRLLECPHLKNICKNGFPRVRITSRENLSAKLIPKISGSVAVAFESSLSRRDNHVLSIEFDHWQDKSKRQILGVVATLDDGRRYLLDLEDVSLKTHSTQSIITSLKRILGSVPPAKINSIISDSAANCKGAREKLVEDNSFSHIIQHRCIAHFINLIGKKFSEDECSDILFECANELASYIANNNLLSAQLRNSGTNRIAKATPVRWYSNVTMLESLINAKEEVLKHIRLQTSKDVEHLSTLTDSMFWNDLARTVQILRPLANCIAVAEMASGCVSEAVHELLEFTGSLFSLDWDDELVVSAISSFLAYFNSKKLGDEMGLMLAAYFLDRRYNMNYITKKGGALVIKSVVSVAKKMRLSKNIIESILFREFVEFRERKGHFGAPAEQDEKPSQWWSKQPDGFLKQIALRFANLRSSSANIERTFSILGLIQGERRTNFSLSSLTDLARAKISMTESESDRELYDSMLRSNNIGSNSSPSAVPFRSRNPRVDNFRSRLSTRVSLSDNNDGWGCWYPGPMPSKLPSDEIRGYYDNFADLIDFTVINESREMSIDQPEEVEEASEDLMAERLLREDRW